MYWNTGESVSGTTPITGLHFEWTVDTATSYSVSVDDITSSSPVTTWSGTISSVSDIQGFRVGLWDSEQDVTVANFAVTVIPEPSSVVLLSLGALALLLRRRC